MSQMQKTLIDDMLNQLIERNASDIFIIAGKPISYKTNKRIETLDPNKLSPMDTQKLIENIYTIANRDLNIVLSRGDDDFSFAVKGLSRFRVNAYKQRGSLAAIIRVVPFSLPKPETMNIPKEVTDLYLAKRGLILVTGPAGSGKTTTLTSIINEINENREAHIVTLEDPIEYLHSHKKSIISQREISIDTDGYSLALRAALRQSPDVIMIGELRDEETKRISLTAAETGHLVVAALHTFGAASSIDRIVDSFPPNQQEQIRTQLSMVLQTVVSQQLVPTVDGDVIPVFEIMHCNTAVRTLIRDGRTHQLNSIIQASRDEGMKSMDVSLLELFKKGRISKEIAMTHALSTTFISKLMQNNQ